MVTYKLYATVPYMLRRVPNSPTRDTNMKLENLERMVSFIHACAYMPPVTAEYCFERIWSRMNQDERDVMSIMVLYCWHRLGWL